MKGMNGLYDELGQERWGSTFGLKILRKYYSAFTFYDFLFSEFPEIK